MAAAGGCSAGGELGCGALQRRRAAADVVHQNVTAETADHEDHTFSGIMFDIKTNKLPLEYVEVDSMWVRGDLGTITVWSTENSYEGKQTKKELWSPHYRGTHVRSRKELKEMKLEIPIYINPDDSVGIYVHSELPGDDAIVYDNKHHEESHKDMYLTITPGMAHLSNEAFSNSMPHGFWHGRPWRQPREFVGRISYGVRWLMWNPDVHHDMPQTLKEVAWSLLLSQTAKAHANGCVLSRCDVDTILFILNKVEWWHMDACMADLKARLRIQKRSRDDDGEPFDAPCRPCRNRSLGFSWLYAGQGAEESSDDEEYEEQEGEESGDDDDDDESDSDSEKDDEEEEVNGDEKQDRFEEEDAEGDLDPRL